MSKRAYVVGGVPRNGPVLLQTDTRVLDAIASAGGLTSGDEYFAIVLDEEVISACDEHGVAMVLTGMRHFRH